MKKTFLFLAMLLSVQMFYGQSSETIDSPMFPFVARQDIDKNLSVRVHALRIGQMNASTSVCFGIDDSTSVQSVFPVPQGLTIGWIGNNVCFFAYEEITDLDYNFTILTQY